MRALFIGLFITLPFINLAQDRNAFLWMSQVLADNARYPNPAMWEGSERFRTLLTTRIDTTKDPVKKAELLQTRALNAIKHGNYDRAFADYEATSQLNPKSRGEVGWRYLFLLHDYSRSLVHLNAFDALTPNTDDPIDDYSVNYLKGRAYAGLHQYEPAVAAYTIAIQNRATRHGPEWVDYRYLVARAVAYLALKQPEKALPDLDQALKNTPKSTMAYYHRGVALQQLGRKEEALDAYQNALFFVRAEPFERDYYYEQPDAAYEGQIEAVIKALKN